jgi:hypothetical protein
MVSLEGLINSEKNYKRAEVGVEVGVESCYRIVGDIYVVLLNRLEEGQAYASEASDYLTVESKESTCCID